MNPIKKRAFSARCGRVWYNPAQSGIMSRNASVRKGLRAMKVRHKQAQGGTRFFHRGYHRGYHRDIMFQRIPVDGAFVGCAEDEGAGEPQFGGFPRGDGGRRER